ncbi:MAG: hypothetical protein ACI9AX_001622, partial [Polaromonas sp.]
MLRCGISSYLCCTAALTLSPLGIHTFRQISRPPHRSQGQ